MENMFIFQQQVQLHNDVANQMLDANLASISAAEDAANRAAEAAHRCAQFSIDSTLARVEFDAEFNRINSAIEAARIAMRAVR